MATSSKPLSADEIEKAVLSVMMQSTKEEDFITKGIGLGLTDDHFFHSFHKNAFQNVKKDLAKGIYPDLVRYGLEWPNSKDSKYECVSQISELYTYQTTSAHLEHHIEILNQYLAYRVAYKLTTKIRSSIQSREDVSVMTADIESAKDIMVKAIDTSRDTVDSSQAVQMFKDRFTEMKRNKSLPGISTGQSLIDAVTGGMKPSELWVYCAYPSGGKSVQGVEAVCQTILEGKNPLYYTMEMDAPEVMNRIICKLAGVEMPKLVSPAQHSSSKAEMLRMKDALATVEASNLRIIDGPNQKWSMIKANAIKQQDLLGSIDCIVIDYIQLLDPETTSISRRETIEKASSDMKQLAKRLKCPVITMAQMEDGGKIKHSRAPGEDGNIVMTIKDRGADRNGNDLTTSDFGIVVNKNRNGERGMLLPLILDGKMQTFKQR